MSAAASVPIALVALAGGLNAGSAYGQIQIANQARDLQYQQIRQQQVELRLQENQASIERMKKLRKVLATEQVMAGFRGISPGSGTARAAINTDFQNFEADETADKLNFLSKHVALDKQREQVRLERNARVLGSTFGFLRDSIGLGMNFYGLPSQSLVDLSMPKQNPFNLNR